MAIPDCDDDIWSGGRATLISGALLTTGKQSEIFIDEKGIIRDIGSAAHERRSEADIIIDGSGRLAMPGLVNTHTHAAMTLLRGYADDMHLQQWLTEKIWPLEAHLTGEDVYQGTRLACLEMIRSGTTAFNDMYFFMDQAAKAVSETGIRGVLCHGMITFGDEEKFEKEVKATERLISDIKRMNNERISVALGPHAPYTVPPAHLEWAGALSREEKIPIHIHLSETEQEVKDCEKTYGVTPAFLLDKSGCLTDKTIAAHGCWLTDAECQLIGEKGAHIAHNPVSNMKLATGRAMPYGNLKKSGVNVTIGTDGCSSNNNLDMFEEMKTAAICQKFSYHQDTLLPAGEALEMATLAGAAALGIPGGVIAKDQPADIILLDLLHPSMVPLHNPVSNIVYAASGGVVRTVICNGKVLMNDGYIPWEEEVIRDAAKTASSLVSRAQTT